MQDKIEEITSTWIPHVGQRVECIPSSECPIRHLCWWEDGLIGTIIDSSTVSDDILITALTGPSTDGVPGSLEHVYPVIWDEEAPNCSTGRFYAAYELEPLYDLEKDYHILHEVFEDVD